MWLDRLSAGPPGASGAPSSQPGSRPYSPLPRRTSSSLSPYVTSQRVEHSPRGSSLSLVSNGSSTSLLSSSSRKPNGNGNGSGLKPAGPPSVDNGSDSLEVLDKLLASLSQKDRNENQRSSSICQADLGLEVDFGGLSLKELAASEPPENSAPASRRSQTAEDCMQTHCEVSHCLFC